ncbi:PHP domain-containing protein [Clostridioides difficile]|uniref:PHP domain-containing protein n=1 Tax=Clostridioides difficile TaxID=1496 RepID=A0A9P3YPJ4_CLODI|nr:PHP domain-containing protein [Clostridioides difficile]AWH79192.1 PHP domain-containing protein [Clostridioides difficile]AWH83088.1 PHP domain-containing protein [Clostridioides difficile]AXU48161.1 phosphoesterase [Clostridioides difficile]AXU51735.1 phosphoesterase [Clostridioides difficile]AXU66293.1 phosphoesterase [Clostridioides difficile]
MLTELHCHTSISDNNFTTEEIIKKAAEKNINILAITNHDTLSGLDEALVLGEHYGVTIIPGIEISAYDYKNRKRVHILGYNIDLNSQEIKNLCNPMVCDRHKASVKMVNKIIDLGYKISLEDVKKYSSKTGIFKQHIMKALIDKGYTDNIYSSLYKELFHRGNGKVYVSLKYVDYRDAIKAIKNSGGICVLAHPGQMDNFSAIEEMVKVGLDGIEVYHPSHNKELEKESLFYAKKYNLVVTGGSDYHGFYSQHNYELGSKSLNKEDLFKFRLALGGVL